MLSGRPLNARSGTVVSGGALERILVRRPSRKRASAPPRHLASGAAAQGCAAVTATTLAAPGSMADVITFAPLADVRWHPLGHIHQTPSEGARSGRRICPVPGSWDRASPAESPRTGAGVVPIERKPTPYKDIDPWVARIPRSRLARAANLRMFGAPTMRWVVWGMGCSYQGPVR